MDNIELRIKVIIAAELGVPVVEIKTEASFVNDLGADSLDAVDLVMALEDAFDIEISIEEVEKITTVQHAIDCVREHKRIANIMALMTQRPS